MCYRWPPMKSRSAKSIMTGHYPMLVLGDEGRQKSPTPPKSPKMTQIEHICESNPKGLELRVPNGEGGRRVPRQGQRGLLGTGTARGGRLPPPPRRRQGWGLAGGCGRGRDGQVGPGSLRTNRVGRVPSCPRESTKKSTSSNQTVQLAYPPSSPHWPGWIWPAARGGGGLAVPG